MGNDERRALLAVAKLAAWALAGGGSVWLAMRCGVSSAVLDRLLWGGLAVLFFLHTSAYLGRVSWRNGDGALSRAIGWGLVAVSVAGAVLVLSISVIVDWWRLSLLLLPSAALVGYMAGALGESLKWQKK